jgi:hypothetical protein
MLKLVASRGPASSRGSRTSSIGNGKSLTANALSSTTCGRSLKPSPRSSSGLSRKWPPLPSLLAVVAKDPEMQALLRLLQSLKRRSRTRFDVVKQLAAKLLACPPDRRVTPEPPPRLPFESIPSARIRRTVNTLFTLAQIVTSAVFW